MAEADAFLQAILAAPDDDTPRLVFADWLDEHGDPKRAEFIRIQCEMERRPRYDARWLALHFREQSIPWVTRNDWIPKLPSWPGLRWATFTLRRGFAARVRAETIAVFREHAEEVFGMAPVEALEMDRPDMAGLAAIPGLSRLRRLELKLGYLTGDDLRRLIDSPRSAGLTEMCLSSGGIARDGVEALIQSPLMPQLVELDLSHNDPREVGPAAAIALAGSTVPLRLRNLDLSSCGLHGEAFALLAASPVLRTVVELGLVNNLFGSNDIRAFLKSPHLTQLARLGLGHSNLRTQDVVDLAASAAFPSLRSLSLGDNRVGPVAARALAASPSLGGLTELELNNNPLGDNGARALADSPYLTNLVVLELQNCKIGDAGARRLIESPALRNLLHLRFFNNPINEDTQRAMRERFKDGGLLL